MLLHDFAAQQAQPDLAQDIDHVLADQDVVLLDLT